MNVDPIIAVRDVEASSRWYQTVFGCTSAHGGSEFDVLLTAQGDVLLCLHKWGVDSHPTMTDSSTLAGNGLILYIRTESMEDIRQTLRGMSYSVEEDITVNPNSRRREFSLRDPDGYYLTVTELHRYEG
jgi:catechol 2,3-dioxygenase-like lactoylglutathione lyase family enzyme